MKRQCDGQLPAPKRQKTDSDDNPELICAAISREMPQLKVATVMNGIVHIEFKNIHELYEIEESNEDTFEFDLMYQSHFNNEWKSIVWSSNLFDNLFSNLFYLKVKVDVNDYLLKFKMRSKLKKSKSQIWTPFCKIIEITIGSSLLAHQFKVGDYVDFRAKSEYYSRHGKIIELREDNYVRLRPMGNAPQFIMDIDSDNEFEFHNPTAFATNNDNGTDTDTANDTLAMTMHDAELEVYHQQRELLMSLLRGSDSEDGNDDNSHNHNRKRREKYVDVHVSRLYGDGIRLRTVIDISNNQENVDRCMLLRSDDRDVINAFGALKQVFHANYAMIGWEESNTWVARFVAKNVCDFLLKEKKDYKWKIGCLREFNDGDLSINGVRADIIRSRIEGLKEKVDEMDDYDVDTVQSYCDICGLEMSCWDWRLNCNQSITNKHDICITCAHNQCHQFNQFNGLLHDILKTDLNDNCIQEIVTFVVGRVCKIQHSNVHT